MINGLKDEERDSGIRKCLVCEELKETEDFEGEDGEVCSECSSDRQFMDTQFTKTKLWDSRQDKKIARSELAVQQQSCCAICNTPETELRRSLALDHDHETSVIRGLLCHMCNGMLGLARDNPYILRKAAAYLEANGN